MSSDRWIINANLYATLRVFLKANLAAEFAEYHPNFFDISDLEAHEPQVETDRGSQDGSCADKNLNNLFTDLNKLLVALVSFRTL